MAAKRSAPAKSSTETVSIRASKAIQRRLKIYAAQIDRDMREVADEALDDYLKKRGA